MIQNLALNWLAAHQQWIEGLAIGFVLANPIRCATLAFGLALKIPGLGPWVAAHPDEAKAWFDGFDKGIDAAVDAYAAKNPATQGGSSAAAAAAPSLPPNLEQVKSYLHLLWILPLMGLLLALALISAALSP